MELLLPRDSLPWEQPEVRNEGELTQSSASQRHIIDAEESYKESATTLILPITWGISKRILKAVKNIFLFY